MFETGLACNPANFASLTPLSFLARSADIHPERIAVVHGDRRFTYREFYQRAKRLASALKRAGVKAGNKGAEAAAAAIEQANVFKAVSRAAPPPRAAKGRK